MTDKLSDRLSRISALRPASGYRQAESSFDITERGAGRLAKLLDGECRANRLGRHMVVKRWFAEPVPDAISPQALRRILPNGYEKVLDPARWLFLDTETTGLAGGTGTYAFLVGIAWWEGCGLTSLRPIVPA